MQSFWLSRDLRPTRAKGRAAVMLSSLLLSLVANAQTVPGTTLPPGGATGQTGSFPFNIQNRFSSALATQTPALKAYYKNCAMDAAGSAGGKSSVKDSLKQAASTLASGASAVTGASINLGGGNSCQMMGEACGDPSGVDADDYSSCSAVNEMSAKAEEAKLAKALDAVTCRAEKYKKIQTQISCLQTESKNLQTQIDALKPGYQAEMQRYQTEYKKMTQEVTDMGTQMVELNDKLNGGGNIDPAKGAYGQYGLRKLKSDLAALIEPGSAGAADTSQIINFPRNMAQLRQGVLTMANDYKIQLTQSCFRDKAYSGMVASAYGGAVSPMEALLASYYDSWFVSPSGKRASSSNAQAQKEAGSKRSALQALLNEIYSDSPRLSAGAPPDASDSAKVAAYQSAVANQTRLVMSPAEIIARYGARLKALSSPTVDVYKFVTQSYSYCFSEAQKQMDSNLKRQTGDIYNFTRQYDEQEKLFGEKMDGTIQKFADGYTNTLRVLTTKFKPFTLSTCQQSTNARVSCFTTLQKNLADMYYGRGLGSEMQILVPHNSNPSLAVKFTCSGIDGCINSIENTLKARQKDINNYSTYMQQYADTANQNVENFTNKIAEQLKPAAQILDDRVKAVNCTLTFLGEGGIDFQDYKPAAIPRQQMLGPDGKSAGQSIPMMPTDMMAVFAGKITPALKNINGSDFSGSLASLSKATQNQSKVKSSVEAARVKFAAQKKACAVQAAKEAVSPIDQAVREFSRGECSKLKESCGYSSALGDLISALSDIGVSSSDSAVVAGLSAGLRCTNGTRERELQLIVAKLGEPIADGDIDRQRLASKSAAACAESYNADLINAGLTSVDKDSDEKKDANNQLARRQAALAKFNSCQATAKSDFTEKVEHCDAESGNLDAKIRDAKDSVGKIKSVRGS